MLVHRLVGFTYSVVKHYNFKFSQESRKDNPKVNKKCSRGLVQQQLLREEKRDVCVCAQSCLCDPTDCSPPGSSVHGFSRQEHCNGQPLPILGGLPDPGVEPTSPASPALAGRCFTTTVIWKVQKERTLTPYYFGPMAPPS